MTNWVRRYRYVPAQLEMKEAQKWLYSLQGRKWLDSVTPLADNRMATGTWLCVKEDIGGKTFFTEKILMTVSIHTIALDEITEWFNNYE